MRRTEYFELKLLRGGTRADLLPAFWTGSSWNFLVYALPTNFGPSKAGVSGLGHGGGLVTRPGKCSALGTLYPMALWG
ncbi:hypothetical protein, partial [Paracoccus sp. PAR01]|uniref:hypothetical protein n=1 Tax=Paracoccus sp. PAR01 TaxID=2769282 RepID=UPI001CE170AD